MKRELNPIEVAHAILQELHDPLFEQQGIQVFVKREDLIHPQISGNKWRKLKYNLQAAQQEGYSKLLTFGGAYSNHILATAAAGKLHGFETIGIIRGEEHLPLNSTLAFAQQCSMRLHYLDRQQYRLKHSSEVQQQLLDLFGDCYIIPEGGSNALAVKGCAEIIDELNIAYDYICTACGTGGTMAGLIAGLKGQKQILGFPALKGATFLYEEIKQLLVNAEISDTYSNWELLLDYHFGGYAKNKPELQQFIDNFQQQHQLSIEFVYTGKLFFGLYDLIKKGYFKQGARLVVLHTGGLRNF